MKFFFVENNYYMNINWTACFFEERVTLKYRTKCQVFTLDSLSLNYRCIFSDHNYFTGKGQRTVNKLMVILPVSVVNLLQTCLSVLG